ncbi:MAG: DUF4349 domain-containing protein [Solirubrobacteraceae bacterium]|jgi:hypothetical protein
MSRRDLNPQASAELRALDAILDGKPVGDEHLELAALIASVRGLSPALDEAGRARLDERIGRLRSPRRRRLQPLRPGRLALAGGPLVALLVAVAVVLGSGVLNGSKSAPKLAPAVRSPASHAPTAAGQSAPAGGGLATNRGAASGPTSTTGTELSPAAGTSATAPATPPGANFAGDNVNPSNRLVARGAALTLASTPTQIQTVANEVVANTQRLGGIVESSNVSVRGISSYASFSLSVPSTRLAQLIGALSSLTAVRSLDQSGSDITDSYDRASTQLADEKTQRQTLISALAQAGTLAQAQALQQKIAHVDEAIADATNRVGALLTRGRNARVSVQIIATSAAGAGVGGSGPVKRALNDALAVLDVALAIALVALAIVLPVGLVALLLFWSTSALRQRSRERALAATASS